MNFQAWALFSEVGTTIVGEPAIDFHLDVGGLGVDAGGDAVLAGIG